MTDLPRVLLDATAVPADRGGVGRYVDNLVPALVRAGVDLWVACQARDREHYAELGGREPITAPVGIERRPARLAWEQTGLVAVARRLGPDVLHSPHYTHPLLAGAPAVVTLHDATFFTDPTVHTRAKAPFFRAATRSALRRAGCCVVPSQASADELVRAAGADRARLQVAYHGVDSSVFAPPPAAAVRRARQRLGLSEHDGYVAFLGTLEPRKNVPALVRGWAAAVRDRAEPPALVLAGGAGWDAALDAAIAEVPAGLRVIRPGYLPAADLPGLLGGADVVAYPSLGEGFGLPVLEAMACGAAVLTTRRLALPEVGGDAVEYTEPDWASLATALRRLLDDPARRGVLGAAGIARAAGFTWDASAAAHLAAYETALTTARPATVPTTLRRRGTLRTGTLPTGTLPTGSVAVVAVTYSPGESLAGFLDSLRAATSRPVDVVLADNGSTDGSVEAAAEQDADLRVVRTGGNVGYGRAVNTGVAATTAEYVLIANPDVVLLSDALDELLAAAKRWPRAGSFGPLIRTADGDIYPSARELPSLGRGIGHAALGWWWPANPWTAAYRRERGAPVEGPTGWLSGSCLLVRRAAFDEVGGFDPSYFMYFEDVDLGDRLGRAGWQNVYVPSAEVVHTGGHATAREPARMAAEHHRSAWTYLSRRYPGRRWAPVRYGIRAGLAARSLLARRVRGVAEGAAPQRRLAR